jgi:MFS transporter, SP family, general alpha glucoside:H+ symporter
MAEPTSERDAESYDVRLANDSHVPSEDHDAQAVYAQRFATTHSTATLIADAKHAADEEHGMSLRTAIRLYPKAIAWSMLLSSTLIMEGYDLALLGSLYASPVFNQKFGTQDPKTGKWAVSAAWQSGLSNGARAGEILGLIWAGWAADRLGYKYTTIASLTLMICFVFVLFFAPDIKILVVGEILCGECCRTRSPSR